MHGWLRCLKSTKSEFCVSGSCTHVGFDLLLHSRGHHDDTDDGDQQEIEGVHDSGSCGLLDLGAAVAAAGAGRRAAAAGHLHAQHIQRFHSVMKE